MNPRRLIGSMLALALLAGSALVPLARATCAVPKAKTAACPGCAGGSAPAGPVVTVDRSCCAAPASLSEREPATVGSDRGAGDHRVLAAAVLVSGARVLTVVALTASPRILPDTPGASPPRLRTTILLI